MSIENMFLAALAPALLASASVAAAQVSFAGNAANEPYIVCKAWEPDNNVIMGSGQADNNPKASTRFGYYAKQYGEQIGKYVNYDCNEFEAMSPEFLASYLPGSTYEGSSGDIYTIVKAPWLPSDWTTRPTPGEKPAKTASDKPKSTDAPAAIAGSTATPDRPDPAAERAARAAEREAEFQRKHAAYEREAAEQKRQVEEFARAEAEVARKKAEQQAKADAVMEAFRRQSEEHAATMRRHQAATAEYEAKLAGGSIAPGPVEDLGMRKFQATGRYRKTREEAMESLMLHQYAADLTDIQCAPATGFPDQWACWGFYLERTTRSGVSKQ